MKNCLKKLKSKFKKYEIDGYVIPKNDDYFTEYWVEQNFMKELK